MKWCAGLVRVCRYIEYGSRERQTRRFERAPAGAGFSGREPEPATGTRRSTRCGRTCTGRGSVSRWRGSWFLRAAFGWSLDGTFSPKIAIEVPLFEVDQKFWFDEHFEGETRKATVRYGLRTDVGSGNATKPVALSEPDEFGRMHLVHRHVLIVG